ncbi:MAG: hypothetical protein HY860_05005 [Chlamydiales bacterium]|nr:hypothetical protein [Chlamydiales bacterium]
MFAVNNLFPLSNELYYTIEENFEQVRNDLVQLPIDLADALPRITWNIYPIEENDPRCVFIKVVKQ